VTGSTAAPAYNSIATYLASPAAIGGTTAAAGTFTALIGKTSLTAGVAGTTAGVLNLEGSTSGAATITAPAVAGTTTNAVVSSNVISGPAGSASSPTFTVGSGTGIYNPNTSQIGIAIGGSFDAIFYSAGLAFRPGLGYLWCTNSTCSSGLDTGIQRDAAEVIDFGNGGATDTTAKVQAAGFQSKGTTFTSNAGCSETSLTGGASKGSFLAGATTCTTTITMGNTLTAANGWACSVWDVTTTADTLKQTATTTTTVTFSGTVASSDKIIFSCDGF
jgi:hypothetical protein